MELQLESSIMGLECTPGDVHSQAEMMSNTNFRNNKDWVTHEILLIPTPEIPWPQKLYLFDLIKWKCDGGMGCKNEELGTLRKKK